LKSGKPRLVIRKTNRLIIAQFVTSTTAQDKIVASVTSHDLLAKGWPKEKAGSLKSLPAAYLTGFMLGKRLTGKHTEAIVDFGMQRNIHKSRLYATVAGAKDAGLSIICSSETLPTEALKTHPLASYLKIKDKL
jgi:large subunit ribosomal protein L18